MGSTYALVTSEEFGSKNPKLVTAFTKATFKGTEYALAHPEESVAILVKASPELKAEVEAAALKLETVARALEGRSVTRVIVVPQRIVNVVG